MGEQLRPADYRAAIHVGEASYPSTPPFDPTVGYAEVRGPLAHGSNLAYDGVRAILQQLYPPGATHGEGADWNPLGELIEPGQTVFIKPNLVDHEHRFGGDVWSVITHPSVVRAVADYVALALRGDGRIIVGDNSHVDCDWNEISRLYRMDLVAERIGDAHGIDLDFVDLRGWHVDDLDHYGWRDGREPLAGDPAGDRVIECAESYLDDARWWLFRGTLNERLETIRAHRNGHRYSFSGTIMDADTYVSIPKLKAHAKVGVTLNIKGLIGTISNKNALVHWSIGFPRFGGDEYPDPDSLADYPRLYWQHAVTDVLPSRVHRWLARRFGETALGKAYVRTLTTAAQSERLLRGAWDGNDTTWRMTADVHNAFLFGPSSGGHLRSLSGRNARPTLSIIDGIVGGDVDGPHFPDRVASGALVGAENLLVADLTGCALMGFDYGAVAYLDALSREHGCDPDTIDVTDTTGQTFDLRARHLGYRPPNRWPNLTSERRAVAEDILDLTKRETVHL